MKNRIQTVLLTLIHLPFLVGYVLHIRSNAAWHFWPLAFIAAALLFVFRNGGASSATIGALRFRIVLDLLLIFTAVVTQQFAFGVLGAVVWLHALLTNHRDRIVESSLAYLTPIILLAIYIPITPVAWLLERMNAAGSKFASVLLDQLGYLHLRTSEMVEVTGQRFTVDELCNGFFSAPALICGASIVLCVQRRKWGHFIPTILASSVFAVLLQALILSGAVIAWEEYQVSLAGSASQLIFTGCVFALTLLCFASFDVLMSFFTDPVSFMGAGMINPFSLIWNRMFLRLPREEPGATEDIGMPVWETIFEDVPFELRMLGSWAYEFANLWFFTRLPKHLLIGVPSIAIAVIAISMVFFGESQSQINYRYESALTTATEGQQNDLAELVMARMLQMDHSDDDLRFRLVQHLVAAGRAEEAQEHLDILTPLNRQGNVAARLWLARHAQSPDCIIVLSEEDRLKQLQRAVEEDKNNVDAHLLLAESYIKRGQFQLAEGYMEAAANLDPRYAADLAALQRRIGRSSEVVAAQVARPMETLKQQLADEPSNHEIRASLAKMMLLQGHLQDAKTLLEQGLDIEESVDLKELLSTTYSTMAARLTSERLAVPKIAELSRKAIDLDPTNETALRLVKQSSAALGPFNQQDLAPAITYWENEIEQDNAAATPRIQLSQLLAACGQFDKAADTLRPAATSDAQLKMELVILYRRAGRDAEADAIVDQLTAIIRERMKATPDEPGLASSLAGILLNADKPQEALEAAEAAVTAVEAANGTPTPQLAQAVMRARLALYEKRLAADDSFGESQEALVLLKDAYTAYPQGAASVIPILAQMSFIDGDIGQSADRMLDEIMATQTIATAFICQWEPWRSSTKTTTKP